MLNHRYLDCSRSLWLNRGQYETQNRHFGTSYKCMLVGQFGLYAD